MCVCGSGLQLPVPRARAVELSHAPRDLLPGRQGGHGRQHAPTALLVVRQAGEEQLDQTRQRERRAGGLTGGAAGRVGVGGGGRYENLSHLSAAHCPVVIGLAQADEVAPAPVLQRYIQAHQKTHTQPIELVWWE